MSYPNNTNWIGMDCHRLIIFLQPLDEFGSEVGDAHEAVNPNLINAQIMDVLNGEQIKGPLKTKLEGAWTVQSRQWASSASTDGLFPTLTLYINQQ